MSRCSYPSSRWSYRGLTSLAAVAVTVLAGALVATPAATASVPPLRAEIATHSAVDTGAPGSQAETIAAAYQAANPGLSVDAARAAAAAQEHAEEFLAGVLAHPETFGGGWFDPYTAQFHVAVTSPAAQSRVAELGAEWELAVRTHHVERTFEELWQQAEELRHGTSALARAAEQDVGIDVRANQVVVALPERQLAAFDQQPPAGVTLVPEPDQQVEPNECISRLACDDSLRAGLRIGPSGNSTICSAGFTARAPNGARFLLTAGHCHGLGTTYFTGNFANIREIGPFTTAIDSGVIDVGAIAVTNPFYANTNSGRIFGHNAPGLWVPVTGAIQTMSEIWPGQTVCLSANLPEPWGPNRCGQVVTVSDPATRGMVRVEGVGTCPGESGGGWYRLTGSARIAVGVHSRGWLDDGCPTGTPQQTTAWFSPLPAWSSWNLQYETG